MGRKDTVRQVMNVFRMELAGTRVIPVDSGTQTLKDAINEAIRDWVTNIRTTHYVIGSVVAPIPIPSWSVISRASSGRRPGQRSSKGQEGFRMQS